MDRRPSGGSENQLESLRGACKKALFFRFAFLWAPRFLLYWAAFVLCCRARVYVRCSGAGFAAARGVRDDASIVPYRGLSSHRVCAFPVGRGPAVGRRGGIYPSRGRSRRRRVRRDEGIPPYGRFIGSAYAGKAACFRREERHVGADSISARGVCGGAGLPGTMRASSPTGGCYIAEVAVSRLAAGLAVGRRGGIYPSRGRLRRRRVRRDEGIPPYGRFIGFAYTGKAACFRREECHVGADSISARGVRSGAGVAGRCEHRPLQGFVITRRLRFPGPPRARRWS